MFLSQDWDIQKDFEPFFAKDTQFVGMLLFFTKNLGVPHFKEIISSQKLNFFEGQKINFPQHSLEEAKEGVVLFN